VGNYGGGGQPPTLYNGSATSEPTVTELVRALYNFVGLEGGESVTWPGGPWVSGLMQKLMGNRLPTPEEQAAYLKAAADFGGGGFTTGAGWIDAQLALADYSRALVMQNTGGQQLQPGASGGGGSTFWDPADVGVALRPSALQGMSADVWNETGFYVWGPNGFQSQTAGNVLRQIGNLVNLDVLTRGVPLPDNPWFRVWNDTAEFLGAEFGSVSGPPAFTEPALIDTTTILSSDTVLSYLQREQPDFAWSRNPVLFGAYSGLVWAIDPSGSTTCWFICCLRDDQLLALVTPPDLSPRQWPGLTGVTLGTPVSVASSTAISVACDGILLAVTSLPPGQGSQHAGAVDRYPRIGWLSFVDFDGNCDDLQQLGLAQIVAMPHTLHRAGGVALNLKPGLVVELTPWDFA
jgi:hypothetical protein